MTVEKVDYEKCTACSYPIDTELNTFTIDLDASVIDKREKSPCQVGCPAGANIPAFIYLLRHGRLEEASNLLKEALILPAITGHLCFHPCESECARKEVDEAVNINSLERVIADYGLRQEARPAPKLYSQEVAIVGSGPAGLSAACYLAGLGYPVTVFESMPAPGGMLRYGIPEYRLPKNVLAAQIDYIKGVGVQFKTGVTIGRDSTIDELKDKGYQAVILSIGAQLSRRHQLDGTELDGVRWGLEFLKEVNLERKVNIGGKVIVIGGGDVAIDVARTASRLGAERVAVVCLEAEEEMPAHREYIQQASDEGIAIEVSWGPKRILGEDGKVSAVELVCCTSVFDKEGGFNPCFDEGQTRVAGADTVILAIGQTPDLSLLPREIRESRGDAIAVAPITLATALPGVFACGDAVSGPTSVVEAIVSGRTAAISADRYLRGRNLEAGRRTRVKQVKENPQEGVEKKARQATPLLPVKQRKGNFEEVKLGFSQEMADRETERCMVCGVQGNCTEVCPMDVLSMDDFLHKPVIRYPEDCMTCYNCELTCPMGAINVDPIKRQILPMIDYSSE